MKDGKVTDTTRIERITDSITALADHGAKVIVLSHYGRPKGKIVPEMSLAPVAEALSMSALRRPVQFVGDVIGIEASKAKAELNDGDIIMLENLRFEAGEEANDPDFARTLATGVDIYVNDAFSCSHRAHASPKPLPHFYHPCRGFDDGGIISA